MSDWWDRFSLKLFDVVWRAGAFTLELPRRARSRAAVLLLRWSPALSGVGPVTFRRWTARVLLSFTRRELARARRELARLEAEG